MKTLICFMCLLWTSTNPNYYIINDILYKMPDNEVAKIKIDYDIRDKDIIKFEFGTDTCFASTVEWIKVGAVPMKKKDDWRMYQVKTTPLFLHKGKFVDMVYFYPTDIKSISLYPIDQAVSTYGCEGLNPIFVIQLKDGKVMQDKPVGGIMIRSNN